MLEVRSTWPHLESFYNYVVKIFLLFLCFWYLVAGDVFI